MSNMIKPPRLRQGDTIGILAPSYIARAKDIEPAIANLEGLGFKIKRSEHLYSDTAGFAGSIAERAADFNAMIADPEVNMLLFGGGEVCNEILPFVDYDNIVRNPKIICSYSDSTTILNAVTSQTSLVTFYGMSPRTFVDPTEYNIASFNSRLMLESTEYVQNSRWRTLTPGTAVGELIGGYLVNLAVMLGGRYLKIDRSKKHILFIEDHIKFSTPAMVSKWFSHIEQSGLFDCVVGLLFGHYSTDEYPVIDEILTRIGKRYSIPVLSCEDFGHGVNNAIIPIGIKARLDSNACRLDLLESGIV